VLEVNGAGVGAGMSEKGALDPRTAYPAEHAALFNNETVTDLGTLPGGSESQALVRWGDTLHIRSRGAGRLPVFRGDATRGRSARHVRLQRCAGCARAAAVTNVQQQTTEDRGFGRGPRWFLRMLQVRQAAASNCWADDFALRRS
jgi:hypothetical protein